ncbi:MAG: CapA family protein [Anaerococcus sp.]|nr:CapA family protein [Anaerococcus sp.]
MLKIIGLLVLSLSLSSCNSQVDLAKEEQVAKALEFSEENDQVNNSIDSYLKKSDENIKNPSKDYKKDKAKISEKKEYIDEQKQARLLFGGDILPHMPINNYAYAYGAGTYDYSKSFEDIKDFAKDFDFFMVNNEFTVNPSLEVSGYPTFNSNEQIYKSLKEAHVDVMSTANNHSLDSGLDGVVTTIEAMNKFGIKNTGTSKGDDKSRLIYQVNGIDIGILSYAEILNGFEYLLDDKEKSLMVNRLNPDEIKKDIEKISQDGADFIVIYPHWGVEYSSYPEDYQIDLAHKMLDWGADLVIGNHPHVIQGMEEYETDDKRKGIIYYSLGNLLSNQKQDYFNGDYRVEQGLLVEVNIKKRKDEKAELISSTYHSTCVDRSYDSYGYLDKTYVATPYLEDEEKMEDLDGDKSFLIRNAYKMNKATIEAGI